MQAAKGHPGKRRTKTEKQIARAEEIAALLAAAPAEGQGVIAPPAMLTDPRCAAALAVWREYAPRLAKMNLMHETDRMSVAMFCVYTAEFFEADDDIRQRGYSMMVKTVSGDNMPRTNPSVDRRDTASKFVLELSKRLGLTPLDRFNLMSLQRTVLANATGASQVPAQRDDPALPGERPLPFDEAAPLDALDSPPPGALQ